MLATVYRYEEGNDGHEGVATTVSVSNIKDPDDEEETRGFPKCLAEPLRQICARMGRPLPHMVCSLRQYSFMSWLIIEGII